MEELKFLLAAEGLTVYTIEELVSDMLFEASNMILLRPRDWPIVLRILLGPGELKAPLENFLQMPILVPRDSQQQLYASPEA